MLKLAGIFFFIYLLIQTETVTSLRCYNCESPLSTSSDCLTLNYIEPKDCEPAETVCSTYILKKPAAEILFRACSPADICLTLNTQYDNIPEVSVKDCEVCDQDECNAASKKISLGFSLVVMVITVLIL